MLPIDRLNVDRRYCRLFVQKPTTHKPISSINILQSYISNIMMTVDICSCNIGPVISRWPGFFLKMCQTTELMLATGILPLTKTIMTSSKLIHIERVDKSCIYWYFCCSSQKTTFKFGQNWACGWKVRGGGAVFGVKKIIRLNSIQ